MESRRDQHDCATFSHQWERLLHREERAAGIEIERPVEMPGRGRIDRGVLDQPRAGDQDVHGALARFDHIEQPVEIGKIGDVGVHGRHVAADLRLGRVELVLTMTDDDDVGPFRDKRLRRRQPDTAAASGDDGNLSGQLRHDTAPSLKSKKELDARFQWI